MIKDKKCSVCLKFVRNKKPCCLGHLPNELHKCKNCNSKILLKYSLCFWCKKEEFEIEEMNQEKINLYCDRKRMEEYRRYNPD